MPKRLLDRILTIWMDDDCVSIRIQRDDKEYLPTEISQASLLRLQRLINQPGISPEVDLECSTIEYYFLKNVSYEEPDDCECKLPEEQCERCKVNGETYSIPY